MLKTIKGQRFYQWVWSWLTKEKPAVTKKVFTVHFLTNSYSISHSKCQLSFFVNLFGFTCLDFRYISTDTCKSKPLKVCCSLLHLFNFSYLGPSAYFNKLLRIFCPCESKLLRKNLEVTSTKVSQPMLPINFCN